MLKSFKGACMDTDTSHREKSLFGAFGGAYGQYTPVYPRFSDFKGLFSGDEKERMESFLEAWEAVCEYCIENGLISGVGYNTWITHMTPVRLEGGTAFFSVKTDFQRNIIAETYTDKIREGFENILGFPVKLDISVDTEEPAKPKKGSLSGSGDNPFYNYTFDNFIVGSSNKYAHAAAQMVGERPGGVYNPLFIYGNAGLGKTHLLFAIRNEILKNNPDARIIYVKTEDFTNEFVSALGKYTTDEFHQKYRNETDVLLIDDIQFISRAEQTQVEFFHTFQSLYDNKKQIVLTSDRPPREIQSIDERIRSRFENGLIADIQPPDLETRIVIVQKKAKMLDMDLPDDVALFIAEKIKNNIRQLEGAVKNLKAQTAIDNKKPGMSAAHLAISRLMTEMKETVSVDQIIMEVARTYGVTADDIVSAKRNQPLSTARQVAIYATREITDLSMAAIGDEFGGRDHSTVVHSLNKVEDKMKHDPRFRSTVQDIIKNIEKLST